jgi:hypothetical protein
MHYYNSIITYCLICLCKLQLLVEYELIMQNQCDNKLDLFIFTKLIHQLLIADLPLRHSRSGIRVKNIVSHYKITQTLEKLLVGQST